LIILKNKKKELLPYINSDCVVGLTVYKSIKVLEAKELQKCINLNSNINIQYFVR